MRKLFTLIVFTFISLTAFSQDIIVKTDKSEIKSKVLEIDDTSVKYKQFDHLEGPTYNIKKADVFMIIYKNGKRETFQTTTVVNNKPAVVEEQVKETTAPAKESSSLAVKVFGESVRPTDNDVDYALNRVTLAIITDNISGTKSTGFGIEASRDFTLLPNYINYGPNIFINGHFVDNEYMSASTIGYGFGGYFLAYLPLNRQLGNLEKQNVGLFPWVRGGLNFAYASTVIESESAYGSQEQEFTNYNLGFGLHLGADYRFNGKFGLTVYTAEFSYFGGGINFKL